MPATRGEKCGTAAGAQNCGVRIEARQAGRAQKADVKRGEPHERREAGPAAFGLACGGEQCANDPAMQSRQAFEPNGAPAATLQPNRIRCFVQAQEVAERAAMVIVEPRQIGAPQRAAARKAAEVK
jgi:hypothetical protein